jgi:hypothetical protein
MTQKNTKTHRKQKITFKKPVKIKLGNGTLENSIQEPLDENFHFYNSLVVTDDLAFQRTHFASPHPTFHVSFSMT